MANKEFNLGTVLRSLLAATVEPDVAQTWGLSCGPCETEEMFKQLASGEAREAELPSGRRGQFLAARKPLFGPASSIAYEILRVERGVERLWPIGLSELALNPQRPWLVGVKDKIDVWWDAAESVAEFALEADVHAYNWHPKRQSYGLEAPTTPWIKDIEAKGR